MKTLIKRRVKCNIGRKIGRKGMATSIAQVLTALAAIGVIAFLYFLMYGKYFELHTIVMSNEAKRHVIDMAQVLLSSDKLVYEEDFGGLESNKIKRFHRAIFDREKLDEQLINEYYFISQGTVTKDSEIRREVSYPNAATKIIVYDMESGTRWILSFGGPGLEGVEQFFICLYNNIDENFFGYPKPYNIFRLWDWWQAKECFDTYETKIGVFQKDFPVLIKEGEELHAGRLFIRVMEL